MAATGIAENEAQQDICGAIADREIRIRFRIAKEDASPREFVEGTVRHGDEVDIPTDLKPAILIGKIRARSSHGSYMEIGGLPNSILLR